MNNSHNNIDNENKIIDNVCGADIILFRNNLNFEIIENIKVDLESADRGETGTILILKQENKAITLDDYVDKILVDIGCEGHNHSTYIELLCNLIDNWSSKYSLYDLFFNNEDQSIRSKDKKDLCEKINVLLEFNVFEYKEKYKKVYEKINKILESENSNNISSMQLLISTKKQAAQDYSELENNYSGLERKTMVDGILHKIESSMQNSIIEDLSQQINKSKKPLTPEEQTKTLNQIFGKEKVSDLRFLYCGDGGEGYSGFETENNDNEYIFTKIGLGLIRDNEKILSKYLGDNIFDYGCGNGRKGKILIEAQEHKKIFGDGDKEQYYMPIDISPEILNSIKENFTTEECGEGILVFDADGKKDSITKRLNGKNTYLFLGGTIGNFSDEDIIKILQKKFGNNSIRPRVGNYLIVDYFTPPKNAEEIISLIKSYAEPGGKKWLLDGLHTLGVSDADIGNLTHMVRYEGDGIVYAQCQDLGEVEVFEDNLSGRDDFPGCIMEGFIANKKFDLTLPDGSTITLNKGEFYPLNKSRRFSEKEINELLKKAGYKRKKLRGVKQGEGMNIAVAVKKGERWQKKKGLFKKLTGALLLAALGAGGAHLASSQREQNDENQKEIFINKKNINVGTSRHLFELEEAFYEQEGYYEPLKQEMLAILWDVVDAKSMSKNEIKNVELMFVDFLKNKLKDDSKQSQKNYNEEIRQDIENDDNVDHTKILNFLFTPYNFYTTCEKKDMINLVYEFIDGNLSFLKDNNCGLTNWKFDYNVFKGYNFSRDDVNIDAIKDNVNSLDYDIQIRVTGEEYLDNGDCVLQNQIFDPLTLKQGDCVKEGHWISNGKDFCYTTESGDEYLVFFAILKNDAGGYKQIMLASPIKEKNIIDVFKENITKKRKNLFSKPKPFSYVFSTENAKIVLDDFFKHKKKIEDRPDILPNAYNNYLESVENNFEGIECGLVYYDSDMWNVSLFGDKHVTLSYDFVKSKEKALVGVLNRLQKDYNEIGEKNYKIYNDQQQKYVSTRIKYIKEEMQEIIRMCTVLQFDIRLEAEKLGLKLDPNEHNYYQDKISELGLEFGPIYETLGGGGYYKSIGD